jgi:mannose-6-phosphate isomerase-like protein (cupin superfamily)
MITVDGEEFAGGAGLSVAVPPGHPVAVVAGSTASPVRLIEVEVEAR